MRRCLLLVAAGATVATAQVWTEGPNLWWDGGSIFGAVAASQGFGGPTSVAQCKAKCVADTRCVAIAYSHDATVGECWGFAFGKSVPPRAGEDEYDTAFIASRVALAQTAGIGEVSFTTDAMSEFGNGCCRKRFSADPKTGTPTRVGPPGDVFSYGEFESLDMCKKLCLTQDKCMSFDVAFPTSYGGKVKCWFFTQRPDRVLCSADQRCYKREQKIVSYDLSPLLAGNGHTLEGGRYKYVFNIGRDLDTPPDSACQTTYTWDPFTKQMVNVSNGGSFAMAYQFPTYQDADPTKQWCHRIAGSAYDTILPALNGGKPQYVGCRNTLPLGSNTGEVSDISSWVYVQSPSECATKCKARGLQFMMLECPNAKGMECSCLGESALGVIPTDGDCSGTPTTVLPGAEGHTGEPAPASNDHSAAGQGQCSGFNGGFTFAAETTALGAPFKLGGWHRGALYALRSNHKWSLIDETNPYRGIALEMEGGDVCKGSGGTNPTATAARSLKINFQCESDTEPLPRREEVTEDNFCEYSFTMQTIHGCPKECAKTNGKICNDIGKCAWDHDAEKVRCACTEESGWPSDDLAALSKQHDTHFGPYCDQTCPQNCTKHGFCEYDTDQGAARCFCNTGYMGPTCASNVPVPASASANVPGVTPAAGAAIGVLVPVIIIFIALFGVLLGAMVYLGRHLKNVKLDPNVYRDPATETGGSGDGTLGHPESNFGLGGYIAPSFF